jgi:peptide/nickel transport system ATP-binding protein
VTQPSFLSVRDLSVSFELEDDGTMHAVDKLSFDLSPGEILGIVGESGCGKSVTTMAMLRLLPAAARVSGHVLFGGTDLLSLSERRLRRIRGDDISFVFQEPMTSLNPLFTIGHQITETLRKHTAISRKGARERALELLTLVRIADPERRLGEYPHQLSGGMCQRAMIAMAIACEPKILIADEPTTALDVTIQAEILDLLRDIRDRLGMAVILITHNLGVVADIADRVLVMYAGRKIEEGPVDELFRSPRHPYTGGLLAAVPRLDRRPPRLAEIPGQVPSLRELPMFCAFADRCPNVGERCRTTVPSLAVMGPDHRAACCHPLEDVA